MWLISMWPNLHVTIEQRRGNLGQGVLHMATHRVDPKHIDGARECVFMTVMK